MLKATQIHNPVQLLPRQPTRKYEVQRHRGTVGVPAPRCTKMVLRGDPNAGCVLPLKRDIYQAVLAPVRQEGIQANTTSTFVLIRVWRCACECVCRNKLCVLVCFGKKNVFGCVL